RLRPELGGGAGCCRRSLAEPEAVALWSHWSGSVQVGELLPCKICGRASYPVALKKHGPICQKTATKKRKTFDSSRQRAEGTDIPTVKPLKPRPEPPKEPSNWRRKHEEFIATVRAAKGLGQALKEGGKRPPLLHLLMILITFRRRFNENAADRHINFCKEQAVHISNTGKFSTDTKGNSTSRTQCEAPALKKSRSALTASSGSSRLPQPSGTSKTVVGVPSGKVSSVSSSLGNKLRTLSSSHKGIAAPHALHSELEDMGRGCVTVMQNQTVPSKDMSYYPFRNPASSVLASKRKTYTESYMARVYKRQTLLVKRCSLQQRWALGKLARKQARRGHRSQAFLTSTCPVMLLGGIAGEGGLGTPLSALAGHRPTPVHIQANTQPAL
ncbi:hypothetical protein EI555_019832, partial [Monodon monoceros]